MSERASRIGISVVNYRAGELTVGCLQSIADQSEEELHDYRVYVVDNASGDDSSSQIENAIEGGAWHDWATFIQAPTNAGFAAGNNIAIRRMLRENPDLQYVLLLNPDTVVRAGAISKLHEFMDTHLDVGIAGGRSEDPDTTPQVCCFRFPNLVNEFANRLRLGLLNRLIGSYRTHIPTPDQPLKIDWVSGAFTMIRREVIDSIGLMDEGYFLYFEETDFILRALRAGWDCWHVPDARVIHYVGQSTGVTARDKPAQRIPSYWFESRRRYFVLNHGLIYALLTDLAVLIGGLLWKVRRLLGNRVEEDKPYFLVDFLLHSSLVRQRRGISARRVV